MRVEMCSAALEGAECMMTKPLSGGFATRYRPFGVDTTKKENGAIHTQVADGAKRSNPGIAQSPHQAKHHEIH